MCALCTVHSIRFDPIRFLVLHAPCAPLNSMYAARDPNGTFYLYATCDQDEWQHSTFLNVIMYFVLQINHYPEPDIDDNDCREATQTILCPMCPRQSVSRYPVCVCAVLWNSKSLALAYVRLDARTSQLGTRTDSLREQRYMSKHRQGNRIQLFGCQNTVNLYISTTQSRRSGNEFEWNKGNRRKEKKEKMVPEMTNTHHDKYRTKSFQCGRPKCAKKRKK